MASINPSLSVTQTNSANLPSVEKNLDLEATTSKTSFVARIALATLLGAFAGAAAGLVVGGPMGAVLGLFVGAGVGLVLGVTFFCKYDDYCEDRLDEQKRIADCREYLAEQKKQGIDLLLNHDHTVNDLGKIVPFKWFTEGKEDPPLTSGTA